MLYFCVFKWEIMEVRLYAMCLLGSNMVTPSDILWLINVIITRHIQIMRTSMKYFADSFFIFFYFYFFIVHRKRMHRAHIRHNLIQATHCYVNTYHNGYTIHVSPYFSVHTYIYTHTYIHSCIGIYMYLHIHIHTYISLNQRCFFSQ